MLRTGHLLRADRFTFTVRGRPWLNQQWGAQLVFAWAHRPLGWAGVAATYVGALAAGFSFLYNACRRAGSARRTAALLTVAGFLVGAGAMGARPQALAIPLFTGTWLLLARRDRWTWLVPVIAIVWANVHGSFVLAPLLAALAWLEDVLERRPARGSALLALATLLATFVTPFGPTVWSYAWEIARNETIRTTVAEWRPPSPLSTNGALFWLSGVAVLASGLWSRDRLRPVDVVRLVLFFALGATSLRSTLWWALAAPPVVARWFPTRTDRVTDIDRADRASLPIAVGAVLLLALIPIGFSLRAGTDPVTGGPARLGSDAPEVLAGATRRALPAGSRLLVFQPFASWFEYSARRYPVMVDSRIELFPDRVWHDYDRAIVATDGWQAILDRYRVAGVVLPPGSTLAEALEADPSWRRVELGEAGSVFVRR